MLELLGIVLILLFSGLAFRVRIQRKSLERWARSQEHIIQLERELGLVESWQAVPKPGTFETWRRDRLRPDLEAWRAVAITTGSDQHRTDLAVNGQMYCECGHPLPCPARHV